MLSVQTRGPGFRCLSLKGKLGVVLHACNPSAGNTETGGSSELLSSQSCQLSELQVQGENPKIKWRAIKRDTQGQLWPAYPCTHTRTLKNNNNNQDQFRPGLWQVPNNYHLCLLLAQLLPGEPVEPMNYITSDSLRLLSFSLLSTYYGSGLTSSASQPR